MKIHMADAGRGIPAKCGASEHKNEAGDRNWAWKPEQVTCKRCLAIYQAYVKRNDAYWRRPNCPKVDS